MRFLVIIVLLLSCPAASVDADDPKPLKDGLYWLTEGKEIASLPLPNASEAHIGGAYRPEIRKASVISKTNRNDMYSVQLECDYTEVAKSRDYVLVVGGVASRRSGGGSSGTDTLYWSFEVEGSDQALAVAKFLGVSVRDRRHPGHQLLVEFAQHGDWQEDGAHEIELSIENVGSIRWPSYKAACIAACVTRSSRSWPKEGIRAKGGSPISGTH